MKDAENSKEIKEIEEPETLPHTRNPRPSIGVDVDYYQGIIDDPEVCESRKRELIEVIGGIMVQFIDLGFGVHPVQLAKAEKPERHQCQNQTEKEQKIERSNV